MSNSLRLVNPQSMDTCPEDGECLVEFADGVVRSLSAYSRKSDGWNYWILGRYIKPVAWSYTATTAPEGEDPYEKLLAQLQDSATVHASILRGDIELNTMHAAHVCGLTNVEGWDRILGLAPPKTSRGYVLPEGPPWGQIDFLTYELFAELHLKKHSVSLINRLGHIRNLEDITPRPKPDYLTEEDWPELREYIEMQGWVGFSIAQPLVEVQA